MLGSEGFTLYGHVLGRIWASEKSWPETGGDLSPPSEAGGERGEAWMVEGYSAADT
jgi:hypothetical protein